MDPSVEDSVKTEVKDFDSSGKKASNLPSFEQQFQELTSLITVFEQCSIKTQELIEGMTKTLFTDEKDPAKKTNLLTEKEKEQLLSYTAKKSTLLVVGQTNSGKSSLINELLGGSYMPTSEVPCTSRIVRLKYSKENYIQVLDSSVRLEGVPGGCQTQPTYFSQKKVPEEAIVLEEKNRGDTQWVNSVVEVGLDNSLLQNGHLEVIDAPGMSENEALDKIVTECLEGALQVIIYVIDGNSSLRLQERGFLLDLKRKVGHLPIFYVCNKVDQDKRAREFDRYSDSDEEEEEEGKEQIPKSAEEKQNLAYNNLVKYDLISKDTPLAKCDFFHGLSSKEVRLARRKKETNYYTEQFDLLKTKLLNFATRGVRSHLDVATQLLCQIQERVFEFFLSCDVNGDEIADQSQLFIDLEQKEQRYINKMRSYIKENKEKFTKIVANSINGHKEKILEAAAEMPFAPIQIRDVVGRNEIVHQCQKQIQDLVLLKVMNISLRSMSNAIRQVTEKLRASLINTFNEVARKDDRVAVLVTRQLEYSFLKPFELGETCPLFDYALMKFGVKYWDEIKRFTSDLISAVLRKGTTVNSTWKQQVAENVLENLDIDAIANKICISILSVLDNSHEAFKSSLSCMKGMCEAASRQSDDVRKFASVMAPDFAVYMCQAKALLHSLDNFPSKADLGAKVGRHSYRWEVYEDRTSGRVAKQLKSGQKTHFLAVLRSMERIPGDPDTILKPASLVLDKKNRVTVLFPRMSTDLFEALESGRVKDIPVGDRLAMVQNMVVACQHCWEKRIYHVDLRITNVLLDQNNIAKLNVSKSRDDAVLYPDEKAPFHVPRKVPDSSDDVDTLKQHCLYSMVVLLWMVVAGSYVRPEYADTSKVEDVFDAIARRDDVKYFRGRKEPESRHSNYQLKIHEILQKSLETWENQSLVSWWYDVQTEIAKIESSMTDERKQEELHLT